MHARACVCACVRAYVLACAGVCGSMRASALGYVCLHECVCAFTRVRVRLLAVHARVCVWTCERVCAVSASVRNNSWL